VTAEVRILHLYPREMDINGDVGNVTALATRARWRGIAVSVHDHHVGDTLPEQIDLVHIGSGPISSQRAVYDDLRTLSPALRVLADDSVPFLAIAGGWQLLGSELVVNATETLAGVGIFPSRAVLTPNRTVGEIVIKTENGFAAGFENHSALTTLEHHARPFGTVVAGGGNAPNSSDVRYEGVVLGESIGTHLHGPLLPMNPALADRLLRAAMLHANLTAGQREPAEFTDSPAITRVDDYASHAREAIAGRLGVQLY
jgi:CobQ-like glutamine amidotransferase family enzyme